MGKLRSLGAVLEDARRESPSEFDWLANFEKVGHFRAFAMDKLLIALQIIVALGILNVWILRSGKPTPFRGGAAQSLREEFSAYGLPLWFMRVIGGLKVICALALVVAIWDHQFARPAAIGLGCLMVGAFAMHIKLKDPLQKSLPSLVVLAMCVAIALL